MKIWSKKTQKVVEKHFESDISHITFANEKVALLYQKRAVFKDSIQKHFVLLVYCTTFK